jgi:hypothetical protein
MAAIQATPGAFVAPRRELAARLRARLAGMTLPSGEDVFSLVLMVLTLAQVTLLGCVVLASVFGG